MNEWNKLSMADRAAYIKLGIDNGITDLATIRDTYNKYAEGGPINPYSSGSLVDDIYKNFKGEEFLGKPSHNYDFTISEEEANRLGYYPDKRGHRDDRVKKPTHPTHPSRGKWNSFEEFELTDRGMENPNYTLFGLNDGGQDPQAVMTYRGGVVLPEITVTPKKNYIHNPYDNINIYAGGGYVREKNDNPIAFDEEGNLVDLVTEEKGTMMLPEITIRGISPETRAKNYSSAYHPEDALEFFDIMTRPLTMPFSVSQLIGAIRNKINGGTYLGSLLGNEENLGIVSENFSKNHPYLSTAANIGIDILTPNAYKLNRFTPTRIRLGVYNNVVPGSYKESYMGSKRKEFKEALIDILSGNTTDDNPKWVEWLELPHIFSSFKWENNPKLATQMRMEAWKKSLGLPHKDKYLLKTGKVDADGRPIVTYNLEEIPLKHLQNFINEVNRNKTVIPDYIGNTGGWVLASKKDGVYRLEDLWDILPFLNPNRESVLPKTIKNKMVNRIETPNGKYPYKLEWKSWVPKWFINLDPTEIVGKGPFRNITELKPTKLSDNQLFYKKPLEKVKEDLKELIYDLELELSHLEDLDPTEAEDVVKNIKARVNKMVEDMPLETLESYRKQFYSPKELLDKYGLFTIQE